MRFAIVDGLPYMVSNGRMFPVEIKDGNVKIDKTNSSMTEVKGNYTLQEITAKCKNLSSIKKAQKKSV